MGFTDWIGLVTKNNKNVTVKKLKESSIPIGAMAAGDPIEAASALGKMIDQRNSPIKVLMVHNGEYALQVTEYAIKMAQRLDCEIIALDITDRPLQFSGEERVRESDRFMTSARKSGEHFILQAQARGVKATHVMDIGNSEEIIARITSTDAGIRYILSKPSNATEATEEDHARVPVFDLRCSRL